MAMTATHEDARSLIENLNFAQKGVRSLQAHCHPGDEGCPLGHRSALGFHTRPLSDGKSVRNGAMEPPLAKR